MISPDDYRDDGIPYLRVQNLGWGTPLSFDGLVYISAETNERVKNSTLRPNDVLFAKTGATIGKTGIIPESMPMANTTSHVGKITVAPQYSAMWVFYVLSSHVGYRQFWQIAQQKTTRPELAIAEIKSIRLPMPSDRAEQDEIVEYLEVRCAELEKMICGKEALLTELETYKKSLIYEYVTGKKEVPVAAQPATAVYPFYPAVLNTKVLRFAQAVLMARILDRHGKGIGRVKLEKMLYTIEASIGFDFDTEYVREAAGPLHESLYKCEGIISRQNKWYQLRSSGHSVAYIPTTEAAKYQKYYDKYFSDYDADIERLINIFKPYDTDQAEVIATLFGAWNDAIIAGTPFTDEDIVDDILANWHERKKRFPRDMWLRALNEMRKKNLIPKGYGKKTVRRVAE